MLPGERQRLLERTLLACGWLDGISALLPDLDLFGPRPRQRIGGRYRAGAPARRARLPCEAREGTSRAEPGAMTDDAMRDGRSAEERSGDEGFLREVLQRVATGPTMSKDLSREEARRAMRLLLAGRADEVQAGIFLIALRMKRESDDELAGILDAIHDGVEPLALDVDELLTLVDPYDGYLRGTPVAPFLPAVLAACGLPTLSHGMREMGPKFGATHALVLEAAGVAIAADAEAARAALADPAVGWCHVLQSALAPELAALETLRTRIVKRPCLTTIEVAVNAFRPRGASHLLTGFVHKGYPPVYARLAREGGFDTASVVRGVEGGVVPSLAQESRVFGGAHEDALVETALDPAALGLAHEARAVPLPPALADEAVVTVRSVRAPGNPFARALAEHAATVGLAALDGQPGHARDSLVYAGAVALYGAGRVASPADGVARVARTLDDGSARARLFARAG